VFSRLRVACYASHLGVEIILKNRMSNIE